jgi:Protein of unknown function (DUF2892)
VKRNMGTLDRVLRTFVIAPVAIVLGVAVFQFGSLFSILALLVAAIMLVSSAVGFCPTYTLFGFSSYRPHTQGPGEIRVAQH